MTGRRIVDICHIFKQIQNSLHDHKFGCSFANMEFISESQNGFFSKFKFICQIWKATTIISSDSTEEFRLPINDAITNGTVAVGKIINIYLTFLQTLLDSEWSDELILN